MTATSLPPGRSHPIVDNCLLIASSRRRRHRRLIRTRRTCSTSRTIELVNRLRILLCTLLPSCHRKVHYLSLRQATTTTSAAAVSTTSKPVSMYPLVVTRLLLLCHRRPRRVRLPPSPVPLLLLEFLGVTTTILSTLDKARCRRLFHSNHFRV